MSPETLPSYGESEKKRVAFTSVIAAVFLTGFKIVVGIMTGSLGILAEAIHSGLDLVAAAVTLLAVHLSDKPADDEHPYGHGKIESFSALFETMLLLATCGWIMFEAVERLFFKSVVVESTPWAFLVMGLSIVIDFGRSRALLKVAKKFKSQALEADALHFSTDIWSSAVVLLGLLLVKSGDWFGHSEVLQKADAVAAMGVACIVLWVSWRMILTTLDVLLDRAPKGFAEEVTALAKGIPGVVECHRVRVRRVGPIQFADLVLDVPRTMPLEQAHAVTDQLEELVRRKYPSADLTVHFEPVAVPGEGWSDRVQAVAGRMGQYVHDVRVSDVGGKRSVFYHLEVDPMLTLKEAHDLADRIEEEVRGQLPGVDEVNTHIENRADLLLSGEKAEDARERVEAQLRDALGDLAGLTFHDLQLYRQEGRLMVALHCELDGERTVAEAHRLSSKLEETLRHRMPDVARVQIHVEPV